MKQGFPLKFVIVVFVTVSLICVIFSTLWTCLLPDAYVSAASIQLESPKTDSNPNSISIEAQVILSREVLTQVVNRLNLNEVWGRRYFNDELIKTDESLKILISRLSVSPIRNTTLIGINSYSDNPREAALIANAVADAYQSFKNKKQQQVESVGSVQIVDRAQPPLRPFKPNRPLNIALGALLGSFLGAVSALLAVLVRPFVKRFFACSKSVNLNDRISHQQSIKQKY